MSSYCSGDKREKSTRGVMPRISDGDPGRCAPRVPLWSTARPSGSPLRPGRRQAGRGWRPGGRPGGHRDTRSADWPSHATRGHGDRHRRDEGLPYLRTKCDAMLARDFTPDFSLSLAAKDAKLAQHAGRHYNLDLPLIDVIARRLAAGARKYGDVDFSATYLLSAESATPSRPGNRWPRRRPHAREQLATQAGIVIGRMSRRMQGSGTHWGAASVTGRKIPWESSCSFSCSPSASAKEPHAAAGTDGDLCAEQITPYSPGIGRRRL